MKKEHLRAIKQYLLVIILTIGAILAGLVATGQGDKIKKLLGVILIGLIGLFAGLSAVDLSDDLADIGPDITEESGDNLYYVIEVIDGDTIKIDGNMKVRLIGIDAPEGNECYYEEAKDELTRLVQGKYVRLEKDIDSVDGLGRLLRYVYLPGEDLTEDDIFVNGHLLRRGYAQTLSFPPNKRYNMLFVKAREQALIQRKGLWSDECDYLSEFEQEHALTREINEPPSDPNCLIKGNISSRGAGKLRLLINSTVSP